MINVWDLKMRNKKINELSDHNDGTLLGESESD